jgi:hypothetical protein
MTDTAALVQIWTALGRTLAEEHGLDDQELFDSLDGELDLADRLRALVRKRREMLAFADALKQMIKEHQARLARLEHTAKVIGDAVVNAMCEAGLKRLPAPDFSASVSYGKAPIMGAESLDPDVLPPRFVRIRKEVDRIALRAALENGEGLDGVSVYLGNPAPFILVRKT